MTKIVKNAWSDEDKIKLKKFYKKYGVKEAARMLNRTPGATRKMVSELGYNLPVGEWSHYEKEYLKKMYPKHGPAYVSSKLGRTYASTQSKAGKMGIVYLDRSRRFPNWTDEQLKYLVKKFPTTPNKNIANWIKKTPAQVKDVAYKLGLRKKPVHIWTDEQDQKLLKMINGYSIDTICRSLSKPRETVINRMRELNLKEESLSDDRFKPSEVADILGISAQTVRNYCAAKNNKKIAGYEKFHGRKLYRLTISQVVLFMVEKIDLWIDKEYDLSYIKILLLDDYVRDKYKKECELIKNRIEMSSKDIKWSKRVRVYGLKGVCESNVSAQFSIDYEDEFAI